MILIVDDDLVVRKSIAFLLKQHGHRAMTAGGPTEAFELLQKRTFELLLLDMNFTVETTGEEGIKTLQEIKAKWPALPVILITGWGNMPLAIEGMKAGAVDFINKPWDNQQLLQAVNTVIQLSKNEYSETVSRSKLDKQYDFSNIIGNDPKLLRVLETVGRVCQTDAPVLILGESGTGKELIAEAIHMNSHRQKGPFVKVNLGGISQSLFESEMFGHKKGAYTGAYTDRKGRFEIANRGSIFLDEMGELDPTSQVKMLRVLQDRRFEVLGSSESRAVDVRVVSATNRNLQEMVKSGEFREDLFFRINLITVQLPALRERKNDIPLLANHFLKKLKITYKRPLLRIQQEALKWLKEQPFYGNIRELKNLVESTVLMSPEDDLGVADFRRYSLNQNGDNKEEDLPLEGQYTLEELEIKMIKKALKEHRYKMAPAARALGISRNALYRRLEKYNITNGVED
ncbi:sigma-54-dependent transcriptional regulator [Xanthovirga aplysinae]|uniref:sigma-54-dependent transcriptional regulator n=1 Tax=Xanthovirga aplysinae TaxID=2529853 RepID=UPI0012BC9A41|nr:sigma-54 dependent transcriptional regulator [Xanthovirga aplysinae]MTI33240.1 sigma-54-dependent Fis family transcriptional regulator [Xanthovirga aplysinae]